MICMGDGVGSKLAHGIFFGVYDRFFFASLGLA